MGNRLLRAIFFPACVMLLAAPFDVMLAEETVRQSIELDIESPPETFGKVTAAVRSADSGEIKTAPMSRMKRLFESTEQGDEYCIITTPDRKMESGQMGYFQEWSIIPDPSPGEEYPILSCHTSLYRGKKRVKFTDPSGGLMTGNTVEWSYDGVWLSNAMVSPLASYSYLHDDAIVYIPHFEGEDFRIWLENLAASTEATILTSQQLAMAEEEPLTVALDAGPCVTIRVTLSEDSEEAPPEGDAIVPVAFAGQITDVRTTHHIRIGESRDVYPDVNSLTDGETEYVVSIFEDRRRRRRDFVYGENLVYIGESVQHLSLEEENRSEAQANVEVKVKYEKRYRFQVRLNGYERSDRRDLVVIKDATSGVLYDRALHGEDVIIPVQRFRVYLPSWKFIDKVFDLDDLVTLEGGVKVLTVPAIERDRIELISQEQVEDPGRWNIPDALTIVYRGLDFAPFFVEKFQFLAWKVGPDHDVIRSVRLVDPRYETWFIVLRIDSVEESNYGERLVFPVTTADGEKVAESFVLEQQLSDAGRLRCDVSNFDGVEAQLLVESDYLAGQSVAAYTWQAADRHPGEKYVEVVIPEVPGAKRVKLIFVRDGALNVYEFPTAIQNHEAGDLIDFELPDDYHEQSILDKDWEKRSELYRLFNYL